ncbi:MAG: hypothetical protein RLZZ558_1479, partial [Planctomycetota bacterium]
MLPHAALARPRMTLLVVAIPVEHASEVP